MFSKVIILSLLISLPVLLQSQTGSVQKFKNSMALGNHIPLADEILLEDYSPTKVMLLGTWHFAYYNYDSHVTDSTDMIDFSTPIRQTEIRDVINRLKEFKPTIICLENSNQIKLDSIYNAYVRGLHKLGVDEEEQIGFRLAQELGLERVYSVDQRSWLYDNQDSVSDDLWDSHYKLDTIRRNIWHSKYDKWYDLTDKFPSMYSVDHALKIENHPQNLKRALGHYMIQMSTSNENGADAFSLKWYNRNVRIFNNILKTQPDESDRILVIYGLSHIAILEHLFDVSPQFELIRPYSYENTKD